MPVHDLFTFSGQKRLSGLLKVIEVIEGREWGMWKLEIKPGSQEQLLLLLFDPSLLPQRNHFTCLHSLTLLNIFYRNYVNLQHFYEQEPLQTFKISIKFNKTN